jgi:hypothetical protein
LLLAFFVFGQAYGIVHRALVPHVVCPIDGELAHGEHGSCASEGAWLETTEREGPSLVAAESGEEHADHCSLTTPHKQRRLLLDPIALQVEPPVPQRAVQFPPDSRPTAIAVFRYAPKQSPPHQA